MWRSLLLVTKVNHFGTSRTRVKSVSDVHVFYLNYLSPKICIVILALQQVYQWRLTGHSVVAHWFSGSPFDCRSRVPWFKSYPGITWISLGARNESPRLHPKVWIGTLRVWKFDIPGRSKSAAHKPGRK